MSSKTDLTDGCFYAIMQLYESRNRLEAVGSGERLGLKCPAIPKQISTTADFHDCSFFHDAPVLGLDLN